MNRSLVSSAVIAIAASSLFAQTPASPPASLAADGPKFVCTNSPFNFGSVWAGARVDHKFIVRNEGNQPLQILEAKPACSCTLVGDYPRIIQPGQSGEFPAVLDTRHKHDQVDVALDITTNEKLPVHKLALTGFVKNVVNIDPIGSNWFYGIKDGSAETHNITLKNGTKDTLQLQLLPLAPTSGFKVELTETKRGQEFVAKVIAQGPFKEGQTQDFAQFKTNVPEVPVYKLELNAFKPPRLNINPPHMAVDGNQREEQKRPLAIMNNGKTPLTIFDITASNGLFAPRLVDKVDNLYKFEVIIPPFYRPPPNGELLTLNTDDAEFKKIYIRIVPSGAPPPIDIVPVEFRENAAGKKTPAVTVNLVATSAPAK